MTAPRIPRDRPLGWREASLAMLTISAVVYGAVVLLVRWWLS